MMSVVKLGVVFYYCYAECLGVRSFGEPTKITFKGLEIVLVLYKI